MRKMIALGLVAGVLLSGCTEGEVAETTAAGETTTATVAVVETTVPAETTLAEKLGVSERELDEIEHVLRIGSDYTRDDIELIRRGKDVLVEFEEYQVFMFDGEMVSIDVNKSLLDD